MRRPSRTELEQKIRDLEQTISSNQSNFETILKQKEDEFDSKIGILTSERDEFSKSVDEKQQIIDKRGQLFE